MPNVKFRVYMIMQFDMHCSRLFTYCLFPHSSIYLKVYLSIPYIYLFILSFIRLVDVLFSVYITNIIIYSFNYLLTYMYLLTYYPFYLLSFLFIHMCNTFTYFGIYFYIYWCFFTCMHKWLDEDE